MLTGPLPTPRLDEAPPHVHDAECWRNSLNCAEYHIHKLQTENYGLMIELDKALLALREIKAAVDKSITSIDRKVNDRRKRGNGTEI